MRNSNPLSKDICFRFADISGKMKNILDDNWQSNLLTIQCLYKANDDFYGNLQTEICLCMKWLAILDWDYLIGSTQSHYIEVAQGGVSSRAIHNFSL